MAALARLALPSRNGGSAGKLRSRSVSLADSTAAVRRPMAKAGAGAWREADDSDWDDAGVGRALDGEPSSSCLAARSFSSSHGSAGAGGTSRFFRTIVMTRAHRAGQSQLEKREKEYDSGEHEFGDGSSSM